MNAIEVLKIIVDEWERQKILFPQLTKDGWMELAIKDAKSLIKEHETKIINLDID